MIDATGMPQSAVVIGGTSDIARATVRHLAGRRLARLLLTGRDPVTLDAAAEEFRKIGVASVETALLDVCRPQAIEAFAQEAVRRVGEIDLVLIAAGTLGPAAIDALDAAVIAETVTTNLAGPAAAMAALAQVMRHQGSGRIVVLSSVAGVRVRQANLVYGASKAGLDGFALALGASLQGTGVKVTVVRPGFVRTKMTRDLDPAPFAVDADAVAAAIVRGLETGADVIWVPPILQAVFAGLRMLPESLWSRLRR